MPRVNFTDSSKDFRAALLGSLGFSSDYIQRKTGLTVGQVNYRLRKAGIRLGDYRAGANPAARQVLLTSQDEVARKLSDDLAKLEKAINSTLKTATRKKTRKVA